MAEFHQVVDVTLVTAYPSLPQVVVPTNLNECPRLEYLFHNESIDAPIDFSLDGINDNGQLRPGKATEAISYRTSGQRLWFKRPAGVFAGTITVQVLATNVLE